MRLPEWIRTRHDPSALHAVKSIMRRHGLSTVCEEARCPNKPVCFAKPTATFMVLGARCTRNCGFCSVPGGTQSPIYEFEDPDPDEPRRVAEAAKAMGLKYVVITSVTRDDLPDGGAGHFAKTISAVRETLLEAKVEVLVPDFGGDADALRAVLDARPDVFNHNVETVPRLYATVRPQADYRRSLELLSLAKEYRDGAFMRTKSGLMLGLGESVDEVLGVLEDLRSAGCDLLTIGQYLRPSKGNLPVKEYVSPETFVYLGDVARGMGFGYVASSPLVRSSMNAEEAYGS
jgi:lipoic acid synthetase